VIAAAYERPLAVHGAGPFRIEADASLTGHTRPGFADLRILDADGRQVPWRLLPADGLDGTWRVRVVVTHPPRETVVRVELGAPLPVDTLAITSSTPLFDRPVEIAVSSDGTRFVQVATGRLARFGTIRPRPFRVGLRARVVRIAIADGDDRPLVRLRVRVTHVRRFLLVRGSAPGPYTLRYGAERPAPVYDFARVPLPATGIAHATSAALGSERRLPSPVRRPVGHMEQRGLVLAALALAAVAVGVAGFMLLRARTTA
jgi:hypothetical protein